MGNIDDLQDMMSGTGYSVASSHAPQSVASSYAYRDQGPCKPTRQHRQGARARGAYNPGFNPEPALEEVDAVGLMDDPRMMDATEMDRRGPITGGDGGAQVDTYMYQDGGASAYVDTHL